ncbi:MAG: long-chain fatty acid--CoA ligase [Alphaproteobacteria bacterium]|nr:long-chain fatty acid--CoA ligase [Alphaproteobacteria bacterium]
MSYETWPSLPAMFFEQAERLGGRPFVWAKRNKVYASKSYGDSAREVKALARALVALGIDSGDRVALISENRPEWGIADLAIMTAGGITVPAYTTNTSRDHCHILTDSGACAVIVSTKALAKRVLPALAECRGVRFVITIEPIDTGGMIDVPIHDWAELLVAHRDEDDTAFESRLARLKRDDIACLIYTSGTGGNPKGVMLRHESIMHNCRGANLLLQQIGLGDEVFLSFLPLSHAYEHTAGLYFPISLGGQIYYAEGVETLSANLIEAKPTIMVSVPRLFEVLRARILLDAKQKGGLRYQFLNLTLSLGGQAYRAPNGLSLPARLVNRVLDRLVRRKAAERFGGRLKAMISGGAPLNPDVGVFFTALGLRLLQGYGQTEAAPVIACNPPNRVKLHTVGPPLDGVEVRIAEDGEILVRGPLVMTGYWNDSAASGSALRDGWLHTGDVGRLDQDGYLQITDRKRDIVVLSGGDNIAPQRLEGILNLQPEIAQAMAFGNRHPYVVALIVPDEGFLRDWASANGRHAKLAELAGDAAFAQAIGQAVERVNRDLSSIERIKRFVVASEPFATENGQMTPTLKVRRHEVLKVYGATLEGLYRS